jgi:hypothetical protein
MDGDDETGFPFASRLGGEKTAEPPDGGGEEGDELVAPGDIYACIKGPRLSLAIEFIDKDRRSFTVPYSYLPLLWWQPPGLLIIEYPGLFSVSLKGKELDELHRRIKDQRITWIREFDEHQAMALSSAVTRIEILRAYPSHEAGAGGNDESGSGD